LSEHQTGLSCPRCKFLIKLSIEDVLYSQEIRCPGCSLGLQIDRDTSQQSIQLLQDIHVAIKNLEMLKKQSL